MTLNTAVSAMEAMQAQWDAAVEANAAELRALREDAARAAEAQNAQGSKLVELKGAFEAKVIAMDTLTKKRRGLAAEEEALRRRYIQLRERRLAKQAGKPPPLPVSLDVDDVDYDSLALKYAPVTAVAAVTNNGTALDSTAYFYSPDGFLIRKDGG